MKKMQVEVDSLRRLCQESRAIAETWAIQLTAQQGTMSELFNFRSPITGLSSDPTTRTSELFHKLNCVELKPEGTHCL